MRKFIFWLFIPLIFFSCKKDPVLTNVIIENNSAPPYSEVTSVQIQNYVNKFYIDLLGREPLKNELDNATEFLKTNSLSQIAREQLLTALMTTNEYYNRFYEIYQSNYLPGATDEEVTLQIYFLEQERDNQQQMGNTIFAQYIQIEINYLIDLQNAKTDYRNGNISISEFMKRICSNLFYDEINMGAENFVLACFENFLKRLPTECPPDPNCQPREKENSIAMIESVPAILFLQDGSSKGDFVEIITNSGEFYQGLVIDIYQLLLARLPSSEEMGLATLMLQDDTSYQAIQRKVLVTDEYAGF